MNEQPRNQFRSAYEGWQPRERSSWPLVAAGFVLVVFAIAILKVVG